VIDRDPTVRDPDARSRRNWMIAALALVAVLAFLTGVVAALLADGDDPTVASPTPTTVVSPTPSPSPEPSLSPTATQEPVAIVLEDGRHYVRATRVLGTVAAPQLEFDLAYFLTDAEAQQAAADRGQEAPNGYFIVNDNPLLRVLPIDPAATVRYIPTDRCCELQDGTLEAWFGAMNETAPANYTPREFAWWWIDVTGNRIVSIEEQYLP